MSGGGKPGTELCSSGREEPRASGGGKIELRERTLFVARKKRNKVGKKVSYAIRFIEKAESEERGEKEGWKNG